MTRAIFMTGIILMTLIFNGCHPVSRQRLLKIFFDGVPDSGAEQEGRLGKTATNSASVDESKLKASSKIAAPEGSRHFPFAEKECDACHMSGFSNKLKAEGKELCFSCHDDFLEGAEVKHFPAEEGMCLDCHNQHQSKYKFLLKRKGQALCLECHDKEDIVSISPHDEIGEENCTSCHDPHKGEEFLLR